MPDTIHFITGNDETQISATATRLVEQLAGPEPDAFAFDVFQETEAGPDPELIYNLVSSLQTPPFLGGTKTVWLKHFSAFSEAGKKSPIGKALAHLAEAIEKGLPNDIQLVMDGPSKPDDKKSTFFKICQKHAQTVFCNRPDKLSRNWQAEMTSCILQAAEAKGIKLLNGVTDYLIEVLGTDTARLDSELEKIICYKGTANPAVSLEDVQQICVGQGEEFSWTFTGAIGQRNLDDCLQIIDAMTNQSKNPEITARSLILSAATFFRQALQIQIFMNQNQLRTPVALKQCLEGAADTQKEIWKSEGADFATLHPFRVQKLAESAVRYRPQETIAAITILKDAYWQCISSSTSPRVSLESALFTIIQK